jgi:integrase
MSEKFRIGKYWLDRVSGSEAYYRFWYDAGTGEVRRRSLKTTDFEQAKIELAAHVLTEAEATPSDPGQVTLIAVLTRYWEEHSDHRPNPSGARRAGAMLLDFLGDGTATVAALTKSTQRAFIKHLHAQGLSVAYISRQLAVIAAALNRAKAEDDEGGMLLRAPKILVSQREIAAMLDAPEPSPDNWHPTLEQVAAFCDAVPEGEESRVLRCALLTLAFAGRPQAVRELRTDQFDARHGLLAFNQADRRQTKKYRPTVPVPPRLLPHLAEWADEADTFIHKDGEPVAVLRKPWGQTLERAGLPAAFTPKSLRHYMATEMRRRGVPREQREEWMGHRRASTNDRYGTFAPDYLREAVAAANAVLAELEQKATLPIYRQVTAKSFRVFGAGEGIRTLDPNLGNVKRSA